MGFPKETKNYFLILSCIFILLNKAYCAIDRPRGVAISKASLYVAGTEFACLDGKKRIPFGQINDDYCDCQDGSDEPGTSACPNGSFHCTNAGHKPNYIPSSRVNDGICDCCDGTDEYSAIATCQNTCRELGRAAREEAQRQQVLMKQGFEIYQEYTQQGFEAKKDNEARMIELENEKEELELQKRFAEQAKEAAEAPEREAKDAHKKVWEEEKQKRDADSERGAAVKAFDDLDTDNNHLVSVEEMIAHAEFDIDSNGEVTEEEAKPKISLSSRKRPNPNTRRKSQHKPVMDENTLKLKRTFEYLEDKGEVDFESFLSEIWPNIKDIYKPTVIDHIPRQDEPEPTAPHVDDQPPREEEPYDDDDDERYDEDEYGDELDDEYYDEDEYDDEDEEIDMDDKPEDSGEMPEYDEETKLFIEEADKAREAFNEVDKKFKDAEREINDIKKFLAMDLGDEIEFYPLKDQCYEYTDREYTYKLCPFEKATQRSKSGGGETSLGKWGHWDGPEDNKYSVMKYENGQGCWNGPNRSVKVIISCGKENALLGASEPNRCEYEYQFSTPAACSSYQPSPLDPEHDEL